MAEKKDWSLGKVKEKFGSHSGIGFFPVKDQVIVMPLFIQPIKTSSIELLGDNKEHGFTYNKFPYQGIVVAVGPGYPQQPTVVRPGMRVFMNQPFAADPQKMFLWDKVNYYKCQEGNICGIADEDIDDPRKDPPMSDIEIAKTIPMNMTKGDA